MQIVLDPLPPFRGDLARVHPPSCIGHALSPDAAADPSQTERHQPVADLARIKVKRCETGRSDK
jgi:hypothetical protein